MRPPGLLGHRALRTMMRGGRVSNIDSEYQRTIEGWDIASVDHSWGCAGRSARSSSAIFTSAVGCCRAGGFGGQSAVSPVPRAAGVPGRGPGGSTCSPPPAARRARHAATCPLTIRDRRPRPVRGSRRRLAGSVGDDLHVQSPGRTLVAVCRRASAIRSTGWQDTVIPDGWDGTSKVPVRRVDLDNRALSRTFTRSGPRRAAQYSRGSGLGKDSLDRHTDSPVRMRHRNEWRP